ncbi:MAG: anion permease [Sporomusaceae bacterium]|nr:anion permease [Sporomusaceae bacterium]
MGKWKAFLAVFLIGAAIWLMPVPAGLKPQAWQLLAIFVATIAGIIMQPLPMGAMALIGITVTAMTNTLTVPQALSAFADPTIWLIVCAFLFARSFIKTGLGSRIAYLLMRAIGDSTLKLGYVLAISDFILAPATPSNTARGGGVLYPIVRSLCSAFDSEPGPTARRIGGYLMLTQFQANVITSAMFMTAMAANPLVASLAKKIANIDINWGIWALAASVPGLIALIVMPYFIYKLYPPELKHTPEAKWLAARELEKRGKLSADEKVVLGVFIATLLLWSSASFTRMNATLVALMGVCVLLITEVLSWKDILDDKGPWDTLIWMGGLVGMASFLNTLGFIPWFAKTVSANLSGVSWIPALLILYIVYMYAHYGFASLTAHVTAMYPAFLAVAVSTGAPLYLTALGLGFISNLCGGLTHYSTGTAPIYFGAGYVDQKAWWRLGFLASLVNMAIWLGVGGVWWRLLSLW